MLKSNWVIPQSGHNDGHNVDHNGGHCNALSQWCGHNDGHNDGGHCHNDDGQSNFLRGVHNHGQILVIMMVSQIQETSPIWFHRPRTKIISICFSNNPFGIFIRILVWNIYQNFDFFSTIIYIFVRILVAVIKMLLAIANKACHHSIYKQTNASMTIFAN